MYWWHFNQISIGTISCLEYASHGRVCITIGTTFVLCIIFSYFPKSPHIMIIKKSFHLKYYSTVIVSFADVSHLVQSLIPPYSSDKLSSRGNVSTSIWRTWHTEDKWQKFNFSNQILPFRSRSRQYSLAVQFSGDKYVIKSNEDVFRHERGRRSVTELISKVETIRKKARGKQQKMNEKLFCSRKMLSVFLRARDNLFSQHISPSPKALKLCFDNPIFSRPRQKQTKTPPFFRSLITFQSQSIFEEREEFGKIRRVTL